MKFAALPLFVLACTPVILSAPSRLIEVASDLIKPDATNATRTGLNVRDVAARDCDAPVVGTFRGDPPIGDIYSFKCANTHCDRGRNYRAEEEVALKCYTRYNSEKIGDEDGWAQLMGMNTYVNLQFLWYEGLFECPPGQ